MSIKVVTNAQAIGDNGKIIIRFSLFEVWGFGVVKKRPSVEQKYEVKKVRVCAGLKS